jgi:GxxExxY protein
MEIEAVGREVIGAAIEVHRTLGPGLLESAYQRCLARELELRRLKVATEVPLPVNYKGEALEVGYRIDLLVEDAIVVENKAVQFVTAVHEAQIITYLKLSGHKLGYLINWNVPVLKDGLKRYVNGL